MSYGIDQNRSSCHFYPSATPTTPAQSTRGHFNGTPVEQLPPDLSRLKPANKGFLEGKPLLKRLICPFKTAKCYFAQGLYKFATNSVIAGAKVGLGVGGVVGGLAMAPIAGAIKLVELVVRSKAGIAKKMLTGGMLAGAGAAAMVTTPAAAAVGMAGGLGVGVITGGAGFLRGIYDGVTNNADRMKNEAEMADFLLANTLQSTTFTHRCGRVIKLETE